MSTLELVILGLTFFISLSLVWNSLRAGITPVPSSSKARQAILSASESANEGIIIELGSGWGTLALVLAERYPHRPVIGYEISTIPWLISLWRKKLRGTDNLTLRKKNFFEAEFEGVTLLTCYLYPKGMDKLAGKLRREGLPATMLISNTFALPGIEPEQVVRLDDLYKSPIYVYQLQQNSLVQNDV